MEQLDLVCEQLGLKFCNDIKLLQEISQKIKIKPSHLGFGVILIMLLSVVLGFGSQLISGLFGFIYPTYQSFKTLEKQDYVQTKHWLTYWTVYSFITLFDPLLEIVLSFIPLYHLNKLAFYVWLFNPKTQGAQTIYEKCVKSLLLKYQAKIDQEIDQIAHQAKNYVDQSAPLIQKAKDIIQ